MNGRNPARFVTSTFLAVGLNPVPSRPGAKRCNIETESHAIEVEQAERWLEGIGQCLYYGMVLEKYPVLILIVEAGSVADWDHFG
jgi:hypothetical protein